MKVGRVAVGGWTACGLAVSEWKQQKRRTARLGGPTGEARGWGGGCRCRGGHSEPVSPGLQGGSVGLEPTREEGSVEMGNWLREGSTGFVGLGDQVGSCGERGCLGKGSSELGSWEKEQLSC